LGAKARLGTPTRKHSGALPCKKSERDDWVQTMIMAGLGVTSIPEFSPVLPGLMTRPYVEPEIKRTVSLVTVGGRRHSPALAAFVKSVKAFDWPN
jgi:DNA-binding transcriptional LysR family regulator